MTVFSWGSRTTAKGDWSRYPGLCSVYSCEWGLSAYRLLHGWVRFPRRCMMQHPTAPTKACLSMDRCQSFVAEGTERWDVHAAMILTLPTGTTSKSSILSRLGQAINPSGSCDQFNRFFMILVGFSFPIFYWVSFSHFYSIRRSTISSRF